MSQSGFEFLNGPSSYSFCYWICVSCATRRSSASTVAVNYSHPFPVATRRAVVVVVVDVIVVSFLGKYRFFFFAVASRRFPLKIVLLSFIRIVVVVFECVDIRYMSKLTLTYSVLASQKCLLPFSFMDDGVPGHSLSLNYPPSNGHFGLLLS